MLADPKASALVANFASQWLGLRQLDTVSPTSSEFDGNLRQAFRKETELLFANVLHEDASVIELLSADYTHVDERLARHYGIASVRGSRFRRVELGGSERRGLLGHGSVLTVTSAPNRTSPVKRGQWILENVLGTPAPPPPDNVETNLDETAPAGAAPTTMRERLAQHMADPGCAACHNIMDPLGFALENFNAVGQYRTIDPDTRTPIDATGTLPDGTPVASAVDLRRALVKHPDKFVLALTENLFTYALGRTVDHRDMPTVRRIVRDAEQEDYRLESLVLGIVQSDAFRKREPVAGELQATSN
jgi:hypothetical protein